MNMPVKNPTVLVPSQAHHLDLPVRPQPLPELEIRVWSRAQFDHQKLGGSLRGAGQRKLAGSALGERLLRQGSVQARRAPSRRAARTVDAGAPFEHEEDSFPYRVAARSTLDSMMEDDSEHKRHELIEALARMHEPLEQYTVLFGALKEIDLRPGIDPLQRLALKDAFNEMMTDLVNRDRAGIRMGLRDGAESSPVSARIDAALTSRGLGTGLRDLRFKIGALAKNGIDEELTPMVMMRALLRNAGPGYAEEAMESVCARLMPGLRTLSRIKEAAYMLTMSDAIAFSVARTAFQVARGFKRDLAERAGLACRLHYAEAALVLLGAAEGGWGKGKAGMLAKQLVDLDRVPLTRALALHAIRVATALLPLRAWPSDRQAGRADLLDDFDRQILDAYAELPLLSTPAERREEEWRDLYAAGRAPTPV